MARFDMISRPLRACCRYLGLLAVFVGAFGSHVASASKGRLVVEGTEFILYLDDGRILRGKDLVGASFVLRHDHGDAVIRITDAEQEESAGGPMLIYRLAVRDRMSGLSQPLCDADAKGRRAGFPVESDGGGFSLTCTSGAEAKCILLGYRPWQSGAIPMRDLHRACVHLIRADYGGDNRPTTRDGTTIDVYDRFGIQSPVDTFIPFEAAWGVDGAVCVARPRIEDNVTLQEIEDRYPRLRGALGPERCNEDTARSFPGALLFNRSNPQNLAQSPSN